MSSNNSDYEDMLSQKQSELDKEEEMKRKKVERDEAQLLKSQYAGGAIPQQKQPNSLLGG